MDQNKLTQFFKDFLTENPTAAEVCQNLVLPTITEELLDACLADVPFDVDNAFIKTFIMNGQAVCKEIIDNTAVLKEAESPLDDSDSI